MATQKNDQLDQAGILIDEATEESSDILIQDLIEEQVILIDAPSFGEWL
jgi:hypothetical protein